MKKNKIILVTGGCGFIGTHLCRTLLKKNYIVHILDKKITNKIKHKNVKYTKANIKDSSVFDKFQIKYYAVFHLAAECSARASEENFKDYIETNFIGTYNLCKWAKIYKPKKLIFSSSMTVYKSSRFSLKENSYIKPNSLYGKTKVEGEKMILNLKKYGIQIIIARLFNVYGPGQNYRNLKQGMVSIYCYYAIFQGKIKVTGSLQRFRDLIYISDVTNALLNFINCNKSEIINVGTGKKTTVRELLIYICKLTKLDYNNSINILSSHAGDVFGTYANINKLKKKYIPKTNLGNGLKKIIWDLQKYKKRNS
tara:strand:- start:778 stop:1707 length:930 start_codon:yes stop_codon:yes gene_type:complete